MIQLKICFLTGFITTMAVLNPSYINRATNNQTKTNEDIGILKGYAPVHNVTAESKIRSKDSIEVKVRLD